jgi:hypothetical protein
VRVGISYASVEISFLRPRRADGSRHKELSQGKVTDMRQTYVEASPEQTL